MTAARNITGREIVKAAKADLERLFLPNTKFEFRFREGSKHALRGTGASAYVQFDTFMLEAPVDDLEPLIFMMLVFGHEAAHYLHRHNDQRKDREETEFDIQSIEMWADFYGTKLALTLITLGRECGAMFKSLSKDMPQPEQIEAMGCAIGRLGTTYFAMGSNVHEDPTTRVGLCAAGVTSFFDSHFGNRNVSRSLSIMHSLYANPAMVYLMTRADDTYLADTTPVDRATDIHQRLQGTAGAITEGMIPMAIKYISLDYAVPLEVRRKISRANSELLKRELSKIFGNAS